MERVDLTSNGTRSLPCRVPVGNAPARRLAATGRVLDGLMRCAGVRADDHVDELTGRAIAGGHCGLPRAEDMDIRALGSHEGSLCP